MNRSPKAAVLWRTRLALVGVWATFWFLWRRGCYLGFPTNPDVLLSELGFAVLFVIVPAALLLMGVPLRRYVAGSCGALLIAAVMAESIASWQEQRFVSECESTFGPTVIEAHRFPGQLGGRMVFLRGPGGEEAFHFFD
jgi:hypothetical protein